MNLHRFHILKLINQSVMTPRLRQFCTISEINTFTWRSHTCGELREEHDGLDVTLCGWLTFQRYDKFAILKDAYGTTQIYFDERDTTNRNFAISLPTESVLQVTGSVKKRPSNKINYKMGTGHIEVIAKDIKLLSKCKENLPFTSRDYEKVNEPLKQKHRYLSLRLKRTQEILRSRSRMTMEMRKFLHDLHGFVDVETPTLFKRTPGGAKEFIVPTKFPGQCYSLVQSPQQFKQLLMVGLVDRYFQIAHCYRNEGTKVDRQPEFTQVDIEASFTTAKDIRDLTEQLLYYSWPKDKPNITIPFPCLTYSEAIRQYGTDKPDIRYEMKLCNLTDLLAGKGIAIFDKALVDEHCSIGALVLPLGSRHMKKSVLAELEESAKDFNLPNLLSISLKEDCKWNSFLAKHVPDDIQCKVNDSLKVQAYDMIVLTAGKTDNVNQLLGKVRVVCAEHLHSFGVEIFKKSNPFSFVWVTEFPLFLKDKTGNVECAHHPFTAPVLEDIDCIYTNPLEARSLHYDLVLNGQEIAGGSIRIHDAMMQKYVLEEILKEDSSELQHLLDALESGCPPHGGIALGIDRLLAIIFGCRSISEVIAFPKSLDGKDLLSGAPAPISEEDKRIYHIETKLPNS